MPTAVGSQPLFQEAVSIANSAFGQHGDESGAELIAYVKGELRRRHPEASQLSIDQAAGYGVVVAQAQHGLNKHPTFGTDDLTFDPARGVGAIAGAVLSPLEKFLGFLTSYRFAEIVGGGILVLLGLYLLGSQIGVKTPSFPGSAAVVRTAGRLNRAV